MTLREAVIVFIITVIAIFVAIGTCESHAADVYLQEQNELWLAQQAAQNILQNGDCAKTAIVRNTKYKLYDRDGTIYINGADYTVRCTEKKPVVTVPPQNKVSLTWNAPTQRENGTPLQPSEIAGYFLYHNGIQIKLGTATALVIPDLEAGKHEFYIQAVDTDGLVSKASGTVSATF